MLASTSWIHKRQFTLD